MKLGIIVDSSAGITKREATKLGWGYLPLFINIDGTTYKDGVDMEPEEYFEMIDVNMNVRTSATPPGISLEMIEKAAKENTHVIVYALSKELSSQTNNLKVMCKELKNVHIVDSTGVGYAITLNLLDIKKYYKKHTWDETTAKIDELSKAQFGFAATKTLDWLVKGGRIGSAVASMANLLKIVPLISFKNGELTKFSKGRLFNKTFLKGIKKLVLESDNKDFIIYDGGGTDTEQLKKIAEEELGVKLQVRPFPPVIINHIGVGVVALMSFKRV
ncbi:MAG: DegV family protein [Mycoplasmataceae bacterium]|nr:DegV family protein [Mycoplasmataceae bacterium]